MALHICTKAHTCYSKECVLRYPVKLHHLSGLMGTKWNSKLVKVHNYCYECRFPGVDVTVRKLKRNEKEV